MSNLYIVATPIGHLKDITLRALEILKSVDLILCEDTRVAAKLLANYKIEKPSLSYHQHSEVGKLREIIEALKEGKNLALITDAGTPGISDPGNELIKKLLSYFSGISGNGTKVPGNISIIPIPGPSAVTTALSVSGLKADEFLFLGFVPKKKGRGKFFHEIVESERTVVFYESSHRILKTLPELAKAFQQVQANNNSYKQIVVARELTKLHETIYRGTIKEVIENLAAGSTKGEFVVMVEGK